MVRGPDIEEFLTGRRTMSSKKKTSTTTPSTSPQTLKIGSRVCCTDDRVEGRIVWANAVSVKIRWDDGEQVTWRRDSLAGRPIEILEVPGDENEHAATCPSEQDAAELPADLAVEVTGHGRREEGTAEGNRRLSLIVNLARKWTRIVLS